MGITKLPNGRWRAQLRRKGLPVFDKVFSTKGEASAALQVRESQAPACGKSSLQELWELYVASYEFEAKAENTRATERCRIQPVLASLGRYSLANLEQNPGAIYSYIDQRIRSKSPRTGRTLSTTSVRLEIAALSSVVAFAKKRRMVPNNFVRHIDRPATQKRKRRVPPIEQGTLHATAFTDGSPLREAARFALLLRLLGCRPGELAGLLRKDIDLRQRQLLFRDTKNGTDRCVHITDQASEIVGAQLAHELKEGTPYLFATWGRQKVWRPYNYSYAITQLRNAQIVGADFHSHAMRREFISRAIEAGLTYSTIRKQTGHKSTQAIEIYDEALSTAPEIRSALDKHAATVKIEQMTAAFESLGITGDDLEQVREIVVRRWNRQQ